ncbi:MAG: hypothetical protein COV31_00200 [Candidatus Yanofskybacteria bacterium CG10_big_fil_rev_8_21_14_0_10_46_23]|uniref:Spore protein YkvP/CgeB glycosyl transferase-like domain-containing protein n=1 Tax=Candidatus Yanofskybacteria bacterium CG10_big_fil_rev_8_21_14_0_10_46_23 TaxID=1975098 RepID=A0A2H0R5N3_9BACT|nr:MAG: hypothetical protein COV31_00200 [Candidatus Yanofskybacteria bacterium CG10_big_fil_rev_8_21_14_0_10_46_23]
MDKNKNNRVLVISPADSFFTMPHVRAFEVLGFECKTFDNRSSYFYSSPILRKLMRVFPRLRIIRKITLDQMNNNLISQVGEYKPFLVFSVKADNIYPETVTEIKKMGVVTACFYIDLMDHWPVISKLAPVYDHFFNQCNLVISRLKSELGLNNCFYMAHSTEPMPENKLLREKKYNTSFIGTHNNQLYPNREKYLNSIGGLGLHIWGTDGWLSTSLKDCFHGRSYGDQRFEIYSNSKIVIDINWDIMPAEGLSNRPFEACGAGALFMTDYVREDIKRVYEEGKEVVLFKNENELREKIEYYLKHDDERRNIALAGYRRTVADHTYMNRVKQLLDTIKNPEKYLR